VWVSKSDKLIEDAQRDWSALGMERLGGRPLRWFRRVCRFVWNRGVLFTTYATLRSDARDEKVSRVNKIVEWLGAISTVSSSSTSLTRCERRGREG